MHIAAWIAYPALFVLFATLFVIMRWVVLLQRRVSEHAERIAHLEGQQDC